MTVDPQATVRALPGSPTPDIAPDALVAAGARVVVRPSGTEPKLKCYLEAVVAVGDDQAPEEALAAARIVATQRLDAIRVDLAEAAGVSAG